MRFIVLITDRVYKQRTLTPGNHRLCGLLHLTEIDWCLSLVGTGCVDKAAIFDVTGKSVWAASANFSVRHHLCLYYLRGLLQAITMFDDQGRRGRKRG